MSSKINSLIKEGEHQQLDFKYCITDSKKIARSLVAFSNSDGGRLLIGVKDNGSITGVRSDEEYYMVESAAQIFSKPEVIFESKAWVVDGKIVLEITVPKGNILPYKALSENGKWLAYIRNANQNLLANSVLLKVWKRKKRDKGIRIKYTKSEKALFEFLINNEIITLNQFCKISKLPRRDAENTLADLIILDIININITEQGTTYCLSDNMILTHNNWK